MSEQNFKDYAESLISSKAGREEAISEGISNLKSRIKDLEINTTIAEKTEAQKSVSAKVMVEPSSIDSVVSKYRSQIKTGSGIETPEVKDQPVTKASVENTKATIRALAGMRPASGDIGEGSCTTPNGNGNVGDPGNYIANVSSFTLEEYQAHIFSSFGLTEQAAEETEEVSEEVELEEELTVVEVLSEALLELEEPSWQEVDRITREVCLEQSMTLKELNSEFRSVFGTYPDKWAKVQVEEDLVGFFPLDEAIRLNRVGQIYDVSFLYRGGTQRFSFFWPEVTRPTFEDMQNAVQKFYPRARLLTFYLSKSQEANFMVTVPPMNESYQMVSEDSWVELSSIDSASFEAICEEVGEPVSPIVAQEEGGYAVVVENHDTGAQETIFFGEEIGSHTESFSPAARHFAVASMNEDWQKANRKDKTDGMSQKAVNAYRRENPGSKLKTAVTEKNPTGKRAGRRRNYCSRSKGQQDMHNIDCSKTPDKRICKARRRWKC